MVAGGDGLARDPSGKVVFVAGALPGERVVAERADERTDYARAATVEVLDPSADRLAPPCPELRRGCGGCGWQHIATAAQPALKREIVLDALRRIAHLDAPDVTSVPSLASWGHRTTVRMGVVRGRAAFHRHHERALVTIDHCLVAHPMIDELIAGGRFASAREVTLRCSPATGERLAVVTPTAAGTSVPAGTIVVGADEIRRGRVPSYHDEVAGRRLRVSAPSFFQTGAGGADALVAVVGDLLDDYDRHGLLVDAYCGVGLFAAALDHHGPAVGLELDPFAVRDARHNLGQRPHTRVLRLQTAVWRPEPAAAVVADPARPGLGRSAATTLAAAGAPVFVLVSCDPASLGRDVALLAGLGYRHERSVLVDLFPQTPHVEVVSRFTATR